jgi:hypothetical protein
MFKECCMINEEKSEKQIISKTFDEFEEDIKNKYINPNDKHKYIKIDLLKRTYFKDINKTTLLYQFKIKNIIKQSEVSKTQSRYTFTDEGIKILYESYFEYCENFELVNDVKLN